jgi:sugar/nucleoside kinase (ribokinase family)
MVAYVAFGLILDDVVYPDGATAMGVLGGGGPQTAFGMRLWSDSVGLVSGVGPDFPAAVEAWLDQSEIDRVGLRRTQAPTLRAWQVLKADGRRTQVWRVTGQTIGTQLSRSYEVLPEAYRVARGFHYGIHPDEPDLAFARELRARGKTVSLEPFTLFRSVRSAS